MLTLPPELFTLLLPFAPLFSRPVFRHVQLLVVGALLTPGRRTIAALLRTLGRQCDPHFQTFHRVLNRDHWSARLVARTLCQLLVQRFVPTGPVVLGLDEHLERRKGQKIAAKGFTGMRRVPARNISPRPVACAGSVSCCSRRSLGPGGSGPCRS